MSQHLCIGDVFHDGVTAAFIQIGNFTDTQHLHETHIGNKTEIAVQPGFFIRDDANDGCFDFMSDAIHFFGNLVICPEQAPAVRITIVLLEASLEFTVGLNKTPLKLRRYIYWFGIVRCKRSHNITFPSSRRKNNTH